MASGTISLEGQSAIVTGAGKGIGRAYALDFAARGSAVVINDLDREAADAVVSEIVAAGGKAVASYDSAATVEGGEALTQTAVSNFGSLEILVNNAGFLRPGYFEDLTVKQIDDILDVHLRGSFYCTQPAWRVMKEKGYGRIIMTSSSSGMFGHQGQANYCAAKAGIHGLTKALCYEGKRYGIKVNMVLPMADSTISDANPIPDMKENYFRFLPEPEYKKLRAGSRRDPDTIAAIGSYLASRECEHSGEAYSICHGRFGRVFVGVADGWLARPEDEVSAETVGQHFADIRNIEQHSVPNWLFEESAIVAEKL